MKFPFCRHQPTVSNTYYLYILYSSNSDKYYVGYSTDPIRRVDEHNNKPFRGLRQEYPTYFGYKNLSELTGYYSLMKKRLESLNKYYNFSDITKEKKREIIFKKLQKAINKSNGDTKVFTIDVSKTCNDIRINCILAVSAEVLIMHWGCAVLDLSVIGGILCHGAATLYQATAGNNCNLNYQQCINQIPS